MKLYLGAKFATSPFALNYWGSMQNSEKSLVKIDQYDITIGWKYLLFYYLISVPYVSMKGLKKSMLWLFPKQLKAGFCIMICDNNLASKQCRQLYNNDTDYHQYS